ncbi:Uncharacterised protein [Mycobacteroides abscessus subsp. abscessus]|nr:Uncharacterised protein [Mycobacteroides abscessus subsp. abscessus]
MTTTIATDDLLAAIDKGLAAGTLREFDPAAGVEQFYTDEDRAAVEAEKRAARKAPKADPAIYVGDTVHTIRKDGTEGRARWIVTEINPTTGVVEVERLVRAGRTRTRYMSMPFPAARLVLVRHGNADDDALRSVGVEVRDRSDRASNPYVLDGVAHAPDAR